MPDTEDIEYESPVPPITAPIPTPQPPLVTDAPGQSAPLTGRVVTMPDRNLFAQQQQDKSEAEYLRNVYQRSSNFEQAQKDVSSARRMLGMMKADREIKAGVPVNEAMFHNMQYFTQPGQAGFAPTLKALQPAPQGRVMPAAGGLPTGYLDPRGVPHWPSQNAMPQPAQETGAQPARPIMSDKGELLGYTVQTGPKTFSHKWLADQDAATKQKVKNNDLEIREAIKEAHAIEKEGAASDGTFAAAIKAKPDLKARWDEQKANIARLQKENIGLVTKGAPVRDGKAAVVTPPKVNGSERVRVKAKDGKIGTIPRSQLEEARKAGYSVMDASD